MYTHIHVAWTMYIMTRSNTLNNTGDFSFARSLAVQHRCRNILATCYDSKEELHSKFPQAEKNISEILDARRRQRRDGSREENGEDTAPEKRNPSGNNTEQREPPARDRDSRRRRGPKIAFSVDARKLGLAPGGGREVRVGFTRKIPPPPPAWKQGKPSKTPNSIREKQEKHSPSSPLTDGPWDLICFNFPHVGGLSTDVNRQVRANQELLVAFFKACLPLLSSPVQPVDDHDDDDDGGYGYGYSSSAGSSDTCDDEVESNSDSDWKEERQGFDRRRRKPRTDPGQILVTLFEGEPYTLWNIRDLARHAGLTVVTSFRFPWTCYQGYSHARTVGEITGKHGGKGGWKGEDRDARTYVFQLNDARPHAMKASKRKRAKDESDSDTSD